MEGSKQVFLSLVALIALVAGSMTGNVVEGVISVPRNGLIRQYYKKTNTCPSVEAFVKHQVKHFYQYDKSITPKLLRLLYSDCMVTGCDGSILLDGEDTEKTAPQNIGLGAFIIIDKIKTVLEAYCPGVVSCADILQLATRDAVALAGGPSYIVYTGRRDGMSSKASSVDLPSPYISEAKARLYFEERGLDVQDLTVLLGAHSMGRARCRYMKDRLYNFQGSGKADPMLDASKAEELRKQCPETYKAGEHEALVFFNKEDSTSDGYKFTNSYYDKILSNKALLRIDQNLLYGNETLQLSQQFTDVDAGFQDYKKAFALSMFKLSSYGVLTGDRGQIRKNCHLVNN